MANRNRREDAHLRKEIEDSLKVSSYKDAIIDAIMNKTPVQASVPQYGDGPTHAMSNESSALPGCSMDMDYMTDVAMRSLGVGSVASAVASNPSMVKTASTEQTEQREEDRKPQFSISARQYRAIQKYPALVELLGSDDGEKIVNSIASRVTELIVNKIGNNSKQINKHAQACVADKQNIKQFFVGNNKEWVCCVIASGPFRGDEAIYFNKDKGRSAVIRPTGNRYEDVSAQFNVVHEYAETEGQE
jgi:hypothetical protein